MSKRGNRFLSIAVVLFMIMTGFASFLDPASAEGVIENDQINDLPEEATYDQLNDDLAPGGYASDPEWYIERVSLSPALSYVNTYIDAVLDSNDNVHACYYGQSHSLMYGIWDGDGWEESYVTFIGYYSRIALDSYGLPHIIYYSGVYKDLVIYNYDGDSWTQTTIDSGDDVGSYCDIDIDSDDNIHISYYNETSSSLKYAKFDGSSWSIQTIDDGGSVGKFTSISVDSQNRPHIVYENSTSSSNFTVKYSMWNGSAWITQTIDTSFAVDTHPTIDIDSMDRPHVAYTGNVDNAYWPELMYARWNGSAWVKEVAVSGDYADNEYPNIRLDSDDHPHISYRDDYTNKLEYSHHNGTGWDRQSIDTMNSNEPYSGFVLDHYDRPFIVYRQGTYMSSARYTQEEITITNPSKGDIWLKGNTHFINWTVQNIPDGHKVRIDAYSFGPNFYQTLSTGEFAQNGSFQWTIPHSFKMGSSLTLKLTYLNFTKVENSSQKFTIKPKKGWYVDEVYGPPGRLQMYPSLILDGNNTPHITWDDGNGIRYGTWNGTQWNTEQATLISGFRIDMSSIAINSTGVVQFCYSDLSGNRFYFAEKNGSNWDTTRLDSTGNGVPGRYNSIGIAGDDTIHVGYTETPALYEELKYLKWNGRQWVSTTINANRPSGTEVDIVLDSNDNPHFGYRGETDIDENGLIYTRWNGTAWEHEMVEYNIASSYESSMDLNSTDSPYFTWYAGGSSDLMFAKWNGTAWEKETVDTAGDVGDMLSMKIDSEDHPHIVYYDQAQKGVKYAYHNGTSWQKMLIFSEPNTITSGPVDFDIYIDSDDKPHIVWFNYETRLLYYAIMISKPTLPTPAINLQADLDEGSVHLSWLPPEDNGGIPITGYSIYRGNSTQNLTLYTNLSAGTHSYIDDFVTNWETYHYEIVAVNSMGNANASNNVSVKIEASVLLVDDDNNNLYESYFTGALKDNSIMYKIWNRSRDGSPPVANLTRYPAVIWTTGRETASTLTSTDQTNLQGFLNLSGKLYLSSMELLYDLNGGTSGAITNTFVNDYLHVTAFTETGYTNVNGVSGDVITDVIPTQALSYPYNNYADELTVDENATTIFTRASNGNTVAIRCDNETFRLVYTAFPFEAIQKTSSVNGARFMNRTLAWLLGDPGTPSPPRNLSTDSGSGYVNLTWEAPLDNGSAELYEYRIYRRNSTSSYSRLGTTPISTLFHNDTTVSDTEAYFYYVTVNNSAGESPMSRQVKSDYDLPTLGTDSTPTSGTTGENVDFSIQVSDNIGVKRVSLEHWFGTGTHTNVTMSGTGPYTYSVQVPSYSRDMLHYIVHASDLADNWVASSQKDITISDNDLPSLSDDTTPLSGTTGEVLNFSIKASDNVGIDSVYVEYWFGTGTHINASLTGVSTHTTTIVLPNNSTDTIHYLFSAGDSSGNWANTTTKDVTIIDNDLPYFGVDTTDNIGYTGNSHTFSVQVFDNVGVKYTMLNYWYTGGVRNQSTQMGGTYPVNTTTVTLYLDLVGPLYYYFTAYDETWNRYDSPVSTVNIYDDEVPVFGTDTTPSSVIMGNTLTFSVSISDNVALDTVDVEYWYGSGAHTTTSMAGSGPYQKVISIPSDNNATLHYLFNASDTSANWATTTVKDITLLDMEAPKFGNDLTPGEGTTGDALTFSIAISDNIEILSVVVVYSINNGQAINATMSGSGTYVFQAIMPWNITGYLDYNFGAVDSSGNWNWSGPLRVDITDNDAPNFGSDITPLVGYTDDKFTFTIAVLDNIGITGAYVEYWFGTSPSFNASMTGTGPYQATITIPFDSMETLHYIFHMADEADNWAHSVQKDVPTFDNDRPMLESDLTPTSVMNGGDLTFHVTLSDNIKVSTAYVEYRFGDGVPINRSMDLVIGQAWELDITIPSDSIDPLHYILHFNDSSDNWNATEERIVIVLDMTIPTIVADHSYTEATTGDPFQFSVEVIDNIEVADVLIMYYFGELGDGMGPGGIEMIPDPAQENIWYYNITIPFNSTARLTYWFEVNDTSNNWNSIDHLNLTVVDNDEPILIRDMSRKDATTGDPFQFNVELFDNIGITNVSVEYWLGTMEHDTVLMTLEDNTSWSYLFIVPDTSRKELHYIFHFSDAAGNEVSSSVIDRNITDNDLPIFLLDSSQSEATTGDPFQFNVSGWDNVGIELMVLEYRFGNSTWTSVNLTLNASYNYILLIPSDPGTTLIYRFTAYDRGGNENSTTPVTVDIVDNDLPEILEITIPAEAYSGGEIEYTVMAADNVGVANVTLFYTLPATETPILIFMSYTGGSNYTTFIDIPEGVKGTLILYLIIYDLNGNHIRYDANDITIRDNIPPVVDPISNMTVYIGDLVNISISATDNIEVATYNWEGAPISVNGSLLKWVADDMGIYDIVAQISDGDLGITWIMFTLTVLETDHDGDGDGIPDLIEVENGLDPVDPSDGDDDKDSDGLSNLEEFQLGTDMNEKDTDGDGMPDGWESDNGLDPLTSSADNDADGDGRTDLEEYIHNTDPNVKGEDEDEPLPLTMILLIIAMIIAVIVIIYLVVSRRSEEEVVVKKKGVVVVEDDYLEEEDSEDLDDEDFEDEYDDSEDLYDEDEGYDEDEDYQDGSDEEEEDLDDHNESIDSSNLQDDYLEDIYEDDIEEYREDDLTQLGEEGELEEFEELDEFEEI